MMYRGFIESGYRILGLHKIEDGVCQCPLGADCENPGKHPRATSWQYTPDWSEEQLEVMEETGQLSTGYGVLMRGLLVIDVDSKRGGVESYNKLINDIPAIAAAGMIVATGSGKGSKHIYFKCPHNKPLRGSHKDYPGIDFKSSGFVVGPGSTHATGATYDILIGSPADIDTPPPELLELLHRPAHHRGIAGGIAIDIDGTELGRVLEHVPNDDCDYDLWVTVGMALHHTTGGDIDGYKLWEDWSAKSSKHDDKVMPNKWHSFGKCANPVTLGSLLHLAEANGYAVPLEFGLESPEADSTSAPGELPFKTDGIDTLRPPGFVGELVAWMNQCSYDEPLEHLNVITALTAIGNVIGLHMTDDITGVTPNLISLCVAESSAGKERVISCYSRIMRAAGIAGAMAGEIKSKQEIMRNLVDHQAAYYVIDEFGETLKTIENARRRGGAPYLEGITGMLLAVSTKGSESYSVSGDLKRDTAKTLKKEIAAVNKKLDRTYHEDARKDIESQLRSLEQSLIDISTVGLRNPYLSLIGYSVGASMDVIMTEEMVKNGLLSRSMLVVEPKENPKPRLDHIPEKEIPQSQKLVIESLASTGFCESVGGGRRIEYRGEKTIIPTDKEATLLIRKLREWQYEYAEHHVETTGYTPLVRRSWELISKISLILAAPGRLRTVEHVMWAATYVKRELEYKIRHVRFVKSRGSKDKEAIADGVRDRIINLCSSIDGERLSVIVRRCMRSSADKEPIEKLVAAMVASGEIEKVEDRSGRGRPKVRYFAKVN